MSHRAFPSSALSALAALLLLVSATAVAYGQQSDAERELIDREIQERVERNSGNMVFTPVHPGIQAADLSPESVEFLAAAVAQLFPHLPHEPHGQPGSSIDGLAIMGTVVDSVGGRGTVALSPEEGEAIASALEAKGIPTRFCGHGCDGRYGDAAVTFHLPQILGNQMTIWILTHWGIGTVPTERPDRILFRADELLLRWSGTAWELEEQTKLREEVRELLGPAPARTIPAPTTPAPPTSSAPPPTSPAPPSEAAS